MSIDKELLNREHFQSENDIRHIPYQREMEFYSAVKSGDVNKVKELYMPLSVEGQGKLSKDPIRNFKYHLIISIAMITRFCIEGGMPSETAYTISDIYINKLDVCDSISALADIHKDMIIYYAKRMQKISAGEAYSKHTITCINMIYENIYNGIRVKDIADKLGLSPQYISKLFKSEVGMNISDYIMSRRIQAAENMLKFSEYNAEDIGNYLNFSSHSHFISAFKKYTGKTPKQFREEFFRVNWKND